MEIRAVDDGIGAINAALGAEADNTVFMVASDNSQEHGGGRKARKGFASRGSRLVPLYVQGPGVTTGICRRSVSNLDLASTICELAGAAPGIPQDGRSFVTWLANPSLPATRLYSLLMAGNGGTGWSAVVSSPESPESNLLYVRHNPWGDPDELYDLTLDPWEITNRINDPAYAGRITTLDAKRIALLTAAAGAPYRQLEGA